MQQAGQRDRSAARARVWRFFRQAALRLDETAFLYDTFVLFEGTLDPVHVIAVSIGHLRNDPVVAMALGAKKQIRNPGHHLTNAELAHSSPHVPRVSDGSASRASATEGRKNAGYFLPYSDFSR